MMKLINRIRFWISLWGGLFFLYLFRYTGHDRDDRPGSAALKLYPDFLKYVAKPKLTIVVSGTNGKTTISSVITDILRMQGMTVSYNDWGANARPGQARCLLDAVNIFNRPIKDAAVIEADELLSPVTFPGIDPDYIVVNNLARDSMLRNAHPEYIYSRLEQAIRQCKKALVIVNGDDPLCNGIAKDSRCYHFGTEDQNVPQFDNILDDFAVCPVCGATPEYRFRNARHFGDYFCPSCGFKAPDRDYFATGVDYQNRTMTVREPDGSCHRYPLISDAMHNAQNLLPVIAVLRNVGLSPEELASCLSQVHLPESRERRIHANGIELITHMAKGQNPTATSTVLQYLTFVTEDIEVVLLVDEVFHDPKRSESVSWIWEADMEFLNRDNIKKIVVAGARYLDHKVRLLAAGVPAERIVCLRHEEEAIQNVDIHGFRRIYFLHDVNAISRTRRICEAVRDRIEQEGGSIE